MNHRPSSLVLTLTLATALLVAGCESSTPRGDGAAPRDQARDQAGDRAPDRAPAPDAGVDALPGGPDGGPDSCPPEAPEPLGQEGLKTPQGTIIFVGAIVEDEVACPSNCGEPLATVAQVETIEVDCQKLPADDKLAPGSRVPLSLTRPAGVVIGDRVRATCTLTDEVCIDAPCIFADGGGPAPACGAWAGGCRVRCFAATLEKLPPAA